MDQKAQNPLGFIQAHPTKGELIFLIIKAPPFWKPITRENIFPEARKSNREREWHQRRDLWKQTMRRR